MEWTRSPWMRAIAMAASLALIVRYWDDRGGWFWFGVVLLVLNTLGLLAARAGGDVAGGDRADGGGAVARSGPGVQPSPAPELEGADRRLSELLDLPGVAAALAAGPPQWRQVSYLDDPVGPAPVDELAAYVWLSRDDDDWELAVGDEVKPYVDLDVDEEGDPVLGVLLGHPAIDSAWHEDREVYRATASAPMTLEDFATLAARALVAHHLDAVRRLPAAE